MSFKEQLQNKFSADNISSLASEIRSRANRDLRCYKVDLAEGIDVKHRFLFSYQLMGYGQAVWDELVRLGFKPQFSWGGEWSGSAGIYVRW